MIRKCVDCGSEFDTRDLDFPGLHRRDACLDPRRCVTALRAENARLRAVVEKAGAAIGHAELWVDPLGIITWRPDAETTCKALFEYHGARAALDAKEVEGG